MLGLLDALLTAAQALALGVPYASAQARDAARSAAEQQFRAYRGAAHDGAVVFDASRSDVLDSSESFSGHNGRIRDYVLTLFVVTPENRYFLFKSSASDKPYVLELPPGRAQLVLKDKFREYSGAA
jgi:hypothetical protein